MAARGTTRRRSWSGWAGIGLLALGLTACGTPQPPAGPPAVDDGLARETPASPADTGKNAAESADRTPASTTTPGPADAGAGLPEPTRPEVAMAVPTDSLPGPEHLMGLSGDQLKSLLGSPGFVRRDPPAEIWQYGTDGCVLDLFLYTREKGGPHRVSHFEFRGRTVAGVTPTTCYRQLLAARSSAAAN